MYIDTYIIMIIYIVTLYFTHQKFIFKEGGEEWAQTMGSVRHNIKFLFGIGPWIFFQGSSLCMYNGTSVPDMLCVCVCVSMW